MSRRQQTGSAMLLAMVVLVGLSAAMLSYYSFSSVQIDESVSRESYRRSLALAEAGVSAALADLRAGGSGTLPASTYAGGEYETEAVDNGDGTWTMIATARHGDVERSIEVVLRESGLSPIYTNAIFAGNSSGDSSYAMDFAGLYNSRASRDRHDEIHGDIYSGGGITVRQDAEIDGTLRAMDSIANSSTRTDSSTSETGIDQPIPDIAAMDYPNNHDVDVAGTFTAAGVAATDADGGEIVPEDYAAHIFRKNPADRTSETAGTAKDDYFLEDPYEPVRVDPNQNGSDAYHISLAGANGRFGGTEAGNQVVYFVDGNLWIHNRHSYSLKFQYPEMDGIQVTFVVRGNIYISDNLFYNNQNKDAVAFIAMEDPTVADSGNVYIGDPAFGTVKTIESFLYAENDFVDNNLDAAGSQRFSILGSMTAGNHVRINRDSGGSHSKMTVTLDERIQDGTVTLPGLPGSGDDNGDDWERVSWRVLGAGQ